jgi:hypothetical protein
MPQLGHTRKNTTKVGPRGASEERETGAREAEETGERTEEKLDWADEVEREYEQKPHTQPTTPRDLSCLRTSAARPWRNIRRRACRPPNPQCMTAPLPYPTHSPAYSWTSYRFQPHHSQHRISSWMIEGWMQREQRMRACVPWRGGTWRSGTGVGVGQCPGRWPRHSGVSQRAGPW